MSASERLPFAVRLRSRRVQKELDALSEPDRRRVLAVLNMLAEEPRPFGCQKLYAETHRVRVGHWRIVYLVDSENRRIEVGGIRRRREGTYKGIEGLFT